MGSVRVAIVGVGNCATSLVQGVEYYRDADPAGTVPGLMHVKFGDYHVSDVEFVAAFDVDAKKVGFDLSEAIFASENNTIKIADVPPTDIVVQRGPTLDGIGKYYADTIEISDAEPVDVVKVLKDAKVDVLVSYLPVGSDEADKFYAQCAIDAGVAFVNALPVFIASDPVWAKKFEDAGVPIVGDDIKSQVGATITHRVMAKLFEDRGVTLDRTYQLNVGGNMDFKNMLERERLESKKISKTQAVTSIMGHELPKDDVYIAPGAEVHPLAVLDTSGGPIYLDEKAKVFPFSRVEGHCYPGRATQIMPGSSIREGNSIRQVCRVGGEVEESIFQCYSNKYHDGFIGHSYVGEFVNLGALTTNSDLKNDYSTVSVMLDGKHAIDTVSPKVVELIGDHAKTSIGTLFNTGSCIGAMAIIMATGKPLPKTIPSFAWFVEGLVTKGFGRSTLYETAAMAMSRRGRQWTEAEQAMWDAIFEITAPMRKEAIQKSRRAMMAK